MKHQPLRQGQTTVGLGMEEKIVIIVIAGYMYRVSSRSTCTRHYFKLGTFGRIVLSSLLPMYMMQTDVFRQL